jgi:hypothetical protein
MKTTLYILLICLLVSSCVTKRATLKTFIDPSIQKSAVKSVAVFQMRNTAFSPGETMEMDRDVTQAFSQINPTVQLMGSDESARKLNEENLASEYAQFLRDFETSGIPNSVFIKKLNAKFNVDAVLQGALYEVLQNDRMAGAKAKTSLTIRYTLLNTINGQILWEGTSHAVIETHKRYAPAIFEVATLAKQKVISAFPSLGK